MEFFSSLPQELIDWIVQDAPIIDKLHLSQSCRELRGKLASSIKGHEKKLYLHPSRLNNVIDLLLSRELFAEKLQKNVTELVVLRLSKLNIVVSDPFAAELHLKFHFWPRYDFGRSIQVPRDRLELDKLPLKPFQDTYRYLIRGLKGLPDLECITYAGSTLGDQDGLCGVSQKAMHSCAEECEKVCRSEIDQAKNYSRDLCTRVVRWSDTEVMMGLVGSLSPKFRRVHFDQPAPCCEVIRWSQILRDVSRIWSGAEGSTVEVATINAAVAGMEELKWTAPGLKGWQVLGLRLINRSTKLKVLELDFKKMGVDYAWHERTGRAQEAGSVYRDDILRNSRPDGSMLQFYWNRSCFSWKHSGIKTLETLSVVGHDESPMCLGLEPLVDFMRRPNQSIRNINFSNVMFVKRGYKVKDTMRDAVSVLKSWSPQLTSASLVVRRLESDDRCEGSSLTDEELRQRYRDQDGNCFNLDCFDELANELGVRIGTEGWDFAENVVGSGRVG